ncbi:hypothetical protein F4809DRAFT_663545 [Biscogniauxia mediterranea]|nr:hypothetical protein F4809DRAFT_663545 [Biscogniauxia mediterranea]
MSYSKDELAYTSSYNQGPAPPPYAECDPTSAPVTVPAPAYEAGGPSTSTSTSVRSKFPPALNAYVHQKLTSTTFHLGETQDAPLFAGELHSGWSGKPEALLRAGPGERDPVLATASAENKWTARNVVVMAGNGRPGEMARIEVTTHYKLRNSNASFAMDVGPGKDRRREEFEWRYSGGSEIKGLEGERWGWKLVRLSEDTGAGGGERSARPAGSTSDGKEVVAVWTHNASWSMKKAFKFQFLGSGLTGVLGDRWAAAVLVSAIRMWWLETQIRASNAAA